MVCKNKAIKSFVVLQGLDVALLATGLTVAFEEASAREKNRDAYVEEATTPFLTSSWWKIVKLTMMIDRLVQKCQEIVSWRKRKPKSAAKIGVRKPAKERKGAVYFFRRKP